MAYALFPILLILTMHFQKLQSEIYSIKYISSTCMCASSSLIFFIYCSFIRGSIDYSLLQDYRFYISQAILIAMILVQIEGRKQCEDNIPVFNFSSFIIISLAPIANAVLNHFTSFENAISANYSSQYSIYTMCLITIALTVIYYKIKFNSGSIQGLKWIVLNVALGTLSIVMYANLAQEYDPYSYMVISNTINVAIFIILSYKNNEGQRITSEKSYKNKLSIVVLFYIISQIINAQIVTEIPVEQYVSIRNIGIILIGYIYYYVTENRIVFTWKDILILTSVMATQLIFTA